MFRRIHAACLHFFARALLQHPLSFLSLIAVDGSVKVGIWRGYSLHDDSHHDGVDSCWWLEGSCQPLAPTQPSLESQGTATKECKRPMRHLLFDSFCLTLPIFFFFFTWIWWIVLSLTSRNPSVVSGIVSLYCRVRRVHLAATVLVPSSGLEEEFSSDRWASVVGQKWSVLGWILELCHGTLPIDHGLLVQKGFIGHAGFWLTCGSCDLLLVLPVAIIGLQYIEALASCKAPTLGLLFKLLMDLENAEACSAAAQCLGLLAQKYVLFLRPWVVPYIVFCLEDYTYLVLRSSKVHLEC